MLKYWRMRRKGLDMKSWRRFKLPYVIKCWERDEGEIMTLLGWEWRKCWVGRAFAEGETLESVGCEKVEGKGERDVRSVAYGYELSFLECTLQGWSRESNTFSSSRERGVVQYVLDCVSLILQREEMGSQLRNCWVGGSWRNSGRGVPKKLEIQI